MSLHAITWALRQDLDDHLSARLLCLLGDYADQAGSCWPAIATLAERVHASAATVRRKLKELVARGLIRIRTARDAHGRQRSNRYHLSIGKSDRPQPERADAGGAGVEPPAREPVAAEPAEAAEEGGTLSELRQGPLSQLCKGGGYHSCDTLTCHKEPKETSEERVFPLPDARARRVSLSIDWTPSREDLAFAESLGLRQAEIRDEMERFRDRALARGDTFADVSAAVRAWLRSPWSILKQPRKAKRGLEVLDELIANLTAAEAGHGPPRLLADLRV